MTAAAVRTPGTGETTQIAAIPLVGHATRSRATHLPRLDAGEYLAVEDGGEVVVIALQDEVTRIGRAFSADIRLEANAVSRRHALVVRDDAGVHVLDDRSVNGVWVNDQRVERATLEHRDRIVLGGVQLTFLRLPAGPSEGTEPADGPAPSA